MPRPSQKNPDQALGAAGLAQALEVLDLERLTGRNELLRTVTGFRSQISPFTRTLDQQDALRRLFGGVAGLDGARRDMLGTAFIASGVSESIRLAQRPFIDRTTRSITTIAAAQLSVGAKQALLGQQRGIATVPRFADSAGFRELARINEDFRRTAFAGLANNAALGAPVFAETLRRVAEPFASSAWRFLEQLHDVDELALAFVERHGWPLPLALPARVVHRVAQKAHDGRREVTRFMVTSFEPRTAAYRLSRDCLLSSPHFETRRQPIKQALQALNRGHYYASISTLLPLVEGVLVDVVLADDPPRRGAPTKAVEQLRAVGDEVDTLMVGSIETLLVSATSGCALFDGFERRDYGGPGESRRLNRHAILHGSARRYGTRANALKLFLLLVALAETLDLYESERRACRNIDSAAA